MNAYMCSLISALPGKAFITDTFEITNIWPGKDSKMKKVHNHCTPNKNHKGISGILKAIHDFIICPYAAASYEVFIGAVNEGGRWTLVVSFTHL